MGGKSHGANTIHLLYYFQTNPKTKKKIVKDREVLGVTWWLGLSAFTAVCPGSSPGWGSKILQAAQHNQKGKKKKDRKVQFTKRSQY